MTQAELIATLIERIDNIKEDTHEIKEHLRTLNGKVADTCVKVAKAEEIARAADKRIEAAERKGKTNSGRIYGLYVAVIALLGGVIAAFVQRGG